MAYMVEWSLNEWITGQFIKLDSQDIEQKVNQWYQSCFMLNKKLDEDNPDAAAIALELRGNIEEFRKHLPLIK